MSMMEYDKAYKLGKKDYQSRLLQGQQPTLKVLDDILPYNHHYPEIPLGLVQIPIERIVGTKMGGRSNAFAGNFMPILSDKTEFAFKWAHLSDSHEKEGIRDPIKAYEYMNEFYVEEGNKRVSVLKYYDAVSVMGNVTRILPPRTQEKSNRIYYEFVDFYELSKVNYIWFSGLGSFAKLQEAIGKGPEEPWTDDDRLDFSFIFSKFSAEYKANGGDKLSLTTGDAFLAFISLYGYKSLADKTSSEVKELVVKSWEEFMVVGSGKEVELKMEPVQEKKPLLNRILPINTPKPKIGFIYEKTPGSSAWTYAHELGRQHIEATFSDEVSTVCYENITQELAEETIEQAVEEGCNIIFSTTPAFVTGSVKAAIAHPDVRILNCSLNTSHRYIRTYYARMYEAKFLMGAIAGAMADNNRLGYIADYPILGAIANINAYALGAKLANPRAEVYLEWSRLKDNTDSLAKLQEKGVSIISGKDMNIPEDSSRYFGLFSVEGIYPRSLAMPLWHWGKFYERLIRTIMDGAWKNDESSDAVKAINYWWGISGGVVDMIYSQSLPIGTKRLADLLKKNFYTESFNPFSGILYSQTGIIQNEPEESLSAKDIITMDWLAENVIGSIPSPEELKESAQPVINQQGLETAER
ncbi:MAG: BMP family ABC transporter substrate-binding protein [Firmicutes bacterium]|nr:BMP family ABC transporter substrate-binding protein [Bacillota bacterium]